MGALSDKSEVKLPPITVQETVVEVRELKTENELLKYRIKQLEKIVKK
mgnify:CR=1 FL=1